MKMPALLLQFIGVLFNLNALDRDNDQAPHLITCTTNITVLVVMSQCIAVMNYFSPTPSDKCGVTKVKRSFEPGLRVFLPPPRTNTVSYKAEFRANPILKLLEQQEEYS